MLIDHMTGPVWVLWIIFGVFAALAAVLLTGRGAILIAGFNTASKAEKEQFDTKKLCRVVGAFLTLIYLFILIMAIWYKVLPISFMYVFMGVTVVGSVVTLVLVNTVCRKKR